MGNIKLRRIPRNELSYKSRLHKQVSNVNFRNGSGRRVRRGSICQIKEKSIKLTKASAQNRRSRRRNEKRVLTWRPLHEQPQTDRKAGWRRQTIQGMRQGRGRRQKESRHGMRPQDPCDQVLNT